MELFILCSIIVFFTYTINLSTLLSFSFLNVDWLDSGRGGYNDGPNAGGPQRYASLNSYRIKLSCSD